jgi:hypothetical protein
MASCLEFFSMLKWLDGSPLIDTIEGYRRHIFTEALDAADPDGRPKFNLVLAGRGKKNWKSADLILACLYTLVIKRSHQGNDCLVLANDAAQAGDDLTLAKRLIAVNQDLAAEIEPLSSELRLRDGSASLKVLPSKDAVGAHGKSAALIGYDEIHGFRTWDVLEALQPDPTRDTLQWVTSYASIYNAAGAPLHDLLAIARTGRDKRMLCSWYSSTWGTDPDFRDLLEPEARANPSMSSWPDGPAYLEQQKLRLPFSRYRRLHLNEPGAPSGAFLDQGVVLRSVVTGRRSLPPDPDRKYAAFVDMSGGSSDDATLAIGHREGRVAVVDRIEKQAGGVPFDPRQAVLKFCGILAEYGCRQVVGDAYAGVTFRADFAREGITYHVGGLRSASDLYEALEPRLNAGEVELLDDQTLIEQLVCLVWKNTKVTHEAGAHDDYANACAGLVHVLAGSGIMKVGGIVVSGAWPDHFAIGAAEATDPRLPVDCRPVYQADQSWHSLIDPL